MNLSDIYQIVIEYADRLKIRFRKECGFDSHRPHHPFFAGSARPTARGLEPASAERFGLGGPRSAARNDNRRIFSCWSGNTRTGVGHRLPTRTLKKRRMIDFRSNSRHWSVQFHPSKWALSDARSRARHFPNTTFASARVADKIACPYHFADCRRSFKLTLPRHSASFLTEIWMTGFNPSRCIAAAMKRNFDPLWIPPCDE
jgi:hypothetical protein